MPNPGKPDAYEEVLALLAIHPIKTWACAKAGISRASFYAKLDRDAEYAELVERAMADGQAPLDAGAWAMTEVAIGEAHRAVTELLSTT